MSYPAQKYSWGFFVMVIAFLGLRSSDAAETLSPLTGQNQPAVELKGPFGIAVAPDGSFYVAEMDAARIAKFDSGGKLLGYIKTIEGYGPLVRPFDVDISDIGALYIVDNGANCVIVLDAQENLLMKLGTGQTGASENTFFGPHFVHIDEERNLIYVADTHNNRIQIFDHNGAYFKTLGSSGMRGPDKYHFSAGMTVDDHGNLYAMNWSGGYINVYDEALHIQRTLGSRGGGPVQFNDAYAVEFYKGTIWVADTYNNRIQQFTPRGDLINIIGGEEGSGINQFSHPTDLELDAAGNLYVVDWKNNRVVKLEPSGQVTQIWGASNASLNYEPPAIMERNPCRGSREIGVYAGIDQMTVDLAAENGVDWIFPSFDGQSGSWNIREQVEYAHKKGVKVAPSIAVYALGAHEPQWENRPQFYMKKKGDTTHCGALSYYWPEVRSYKARHIAEQAEIANVDGILLDYIRYPDVISGYEPEMVAAFAEQTGLNALELSPEHPRWLEFRAKYITDFIAELRFELAQRNRSLRLSVYVGPEWQSDLKLVLRNWRDWVYMGIVDELCLGIYSRDFESFYEGVLQARRNSPERTKINIMIACWGGNLNTPELLKKGAQVAFAANPDMVSIYRSDTIYEKNLWSVIGEIAAEYKK